MKAQRLAADYRSFSELTKQQFKVKQEIFGIIVTWIHKDDTLITAGLLLELVLAVLRGGLNTTIINWRWSLRAARGHISLMWGE